MVWEYPRRSHYRELLRDQTLLTMLPTMDALQYVASYGVDEEVMRNLVDKQRRVFSVAMRLYVEILV